MRPLRLVTLLTFVIILSAVQAHAATLFGRVIEVNEGDVIKVMNMNRPARIRLMGLDAPEMNQAFGDVARQHLSDLILGQNVVVEYSGIGRDGTIVGRVLLNDADMNAQMIRDGAAWFDPTSKNELGQEQAEIYFQSEQAARSEKRGLWQGEDAIAPWQFVKNEQIKKQNSVNPVRPNDNAKPVRTRTELTSESLINTAGASPANADMSWMTAESKTWEMFQPQGESFSALVPSGGRLTKEPIPFGAGTIDVNVYMAKNGTSIYALMWATGPATTETDLDVIKSTLGGFLRGIGAGYEKVGGQFSCEPGRGAEVSAGGFTGRSFNLSGCTVPAVARVFTKAVGNKRQVYLGAAFYYGEDENVDRFMQSFTVKGNGTPVNTVKGSGTTPKVSRSGSK